MESLHQVLGVGSQATALEIRQAYRRMALVHHPDKGGNTATFRMVRLAFEMLSSEIRRRSYDEHVALYQHRDRSEGSVKRASRSMPFKTSRSSPSRETSSSTMAPGLRLGAGVPPRKHDPEGRKPRAILLRSLRRLYVLLASQSHSKRQESVESLSPLLREELVAFVSHHRARFGQFSGSPDIQQTRGIQQARYGGAAAGPERFWLCGQVGGAFSGGCAGFPCA